MTTPNPAAPPRPPEHGPSDGCGELLWAHMEAQPGFSEELAQAESDIAKGRGVPIRAVAPKRHKHEPGYVEHVTEKVRREVWHPSPVGGLCIHCHKALPKRRKAAR